MTIHSVEMKYFLTTGTLNKDPEIALTAKKFQTIQTAKFMLDSALRIEEEYEIVQN